MSHLPQSKYLDTNKLGAIFSNTTSSYKFFWFSQIIKRAMQGVEVDTIQNIAEDMLISAYYLVNECKLKLGYKDELEEIAKYVYKKYSIQSNLSFGELKKCFNRNGVFEDISVLKKLEILKNNVPIRLLSPFMNREEKEKVFNERNINETNLECDEQRKHGNAIPYRFGEVDGVDNKIILDDNFIDYVENNYGILDDFDKYNLVEYLQKRNPSVPGIINKLEPATVRNLKKL